MVRQQDSDNERRRRSSPFGTGRRRLANYGSKSYGSKHVAARDGQMDTGPTRSTRGRGCHFGANEKKPTLEADESS